MLKRLFSIITISLVLTGSFFSAYNIKYPVYADSTTDSWLNVTTNEQLVEAFRYYCKSRDLTIEGSSADVLTSFTTQTFNGICNMLGIDMTALQAQIKYQTDGNIGTKFLFSAMGVNAFNRIFAQFLQDNELNIGDNVEDEVVYSGDVFTDKDGYKCLVYYVDSLNSNASSTHSVIKHGTYYKYSTDDLVSMAGNYAIYNIADGLSQNDTRIYSYDSRPYHFYSFLPTNDINNESTALIKANELQSGLIVRFGYRAIFYNIDTHKYYYGHFLNVVSPSVDNPTVSANYWSCFWEIPEPNKTNASVTITTNNNVINNNNYEGDTIINNNGDVINNNYPDPNPNPTPDPPTIPDSGGWQDFSLPEMPNDWLIYGMEKKFPFDIPFNILFALSLLNHEPEIPKFEGDIDLKVCTWHYDIDLTPFDDIAIILRRFEVLAFIIGLAILTKELINWG